MAQGNGVTFCYVGRVEGQRRPRANFKRKGIHKDPKDKKLEAAIRAAFLEQCPGVFFEKGVPLRMSVHAYRPLPDSKPKRITAEPDVLKPDGSNILKAVEDALNGVAYHDDAQIVESHVTKHRRIRGAVERITVMISRCEYDVCI
jgi:Holliday junction resolvase RusA-like endonuclease